MKKKTHSKKIISAKKKDGDILDKMNSFFEKHEKTCLLISLAAGAVISILLFDCKVSLSGDDCDYIMNAQEFIRRFTYPGGRGALYPIAISPFLAGGLNLILLKSLSAVFIILSMWLMYKSFRGKVPASVLMPTLLIANICPYIFFYACHTYSEPFFMLTQSLFIYLFSRYFWNGEQTASVPLKTGWKKFLLLGLCFLAMGLTRTVGYAVMGAVIVYFCLRKQWKNLLYSFVASGLVFVLFSIIKKTVWPESGAAYSINNYLARNYYNVGQGMEDLPGFINRLIENSHVYLSGFLYKFMGFRSSADLPLGSMPILTVITYILFFIGIMAIYKKNTPLLFAGVYVGIMNFASFILLQSMWAQDRLIMIYYPLILLFLLGGMYYLLKGGRFGKFSWIYPVLLVSVFVGTGVHLKAKVENNLPVLQQNLAGNDLYGLTPDWENFIKMSRWANDNLDKDAVIISRKPSISYVYTGRRFGGFFNVPHVEIDEIIARGQEEKARYVFIAAELKNTNLAALAPFSEYAFVARNNSDKFSINGKSIKVAMVYKVDKTLFNDDLINLLETDGVNYTLDYDAFLKQYAEDNSASYQTVSPDLLLKIIRDSRAKYLLLPKIRIYPPQNTGQFVNTIHQYISFIQFKYPNTFRIIHTIGKDEACELAEYTGE